MRTTNFRLNYDDYYCRTTIVAMICIIIFIIIKICVCVYINNNDDYYKNYTTDRNKLFVESIMEYKKDNVVKIEEPLFKNPQYTPTTGVKTNHGNSLPMSVVPAVFK